MSMRQSYFEWSQLDFPKESYQKRRAKLRSLLEECDGVMLIPSREGIGVQTFRQSDNFLYFTGLEAPDSVLVIDSRGQDTCYMPHEDQRFTSEARPNDFPGRDLLDDPAIFSRSGIANLLPFDSFSSFLHTLKGRNLYLSLPDRTPPHEIKTAFFFNWNCEQRFAKHLTSVYPDIDFLNGFDMIAKLRMIKSEEEISKIRQAVQITEQSILETIPLIRPGIDERTLIGHLEYGYKKRGSQRVAFDSIVKTEINCHRPWRILGSHYNRRNRVIPTDGIVIFDVGAEFDYYASDIGRTFPVNEQFDPLHASAIDRVADVVDAIKETIKPGVRFSELRHVALSALNPRYHRSMQVDSYYGHHIGLSAGDPSIMDEPLQEGMVLTIEPWYYNHQENCSVFTEENVVVRDYGVELLSSFFPYRARALESIRNNHFGVSEC